MPSPRAATSPENSCPGMTGSGRGPPSRVAQVGTHSNSVGVTAAALTRTSTSPAPGRGAGASSKRSDSGPPRACVRMAFMGLLVKYLRVAGAPGQRAANVAEVHVKQLALTAEAANALEDLFPGAAWACLDQVRLALRRSRRR